MTNKGGRVRLVRCTDPYTRLEPGSERAVSIIDALGTVHVDWDSGSKLGLVPGEDRWEAARSRVNPDASLLRQELERRC
jgi:hypothetical protein